MRGISTAASGRAFSAGAVLVVGGALALYQMTSLVLGPAGSRQLHLSLAVPTIGADELSEPVSPGVKYVLGMVVRGAPAPSVTAPRRALGRPAEPPATGTAPPAPAPIVTTPQTLPVASQPATKYVPGHPEPPKRDGNQ